MAKVLQVLNPLNCPLIVHEVVQGGDLGERAGQT